MDSDAGVLLAQTGAGHAVTLGLMRCGRIWLCPVCSASIRHKRAEEITKAVVDWIDQGGTAYLVTGTVRHGLADKLTTLMDALQGTRPDPASGVKRKAGAYQRMITGAAWAGDARKKANTEGIRGRLGYVGMIRATEVNVGTENGWHPHIHAIVFVGGRTAGTKADRKVVEVFEPSESAIHEWMDHFRSVWTRALTQIDPAFKPSDEHGMDFKPLRTAQDARDLGRYIAKDQDGKNPALELARGDLKRGRHENMTPFQLLERIGHISGGALADDAEGRGSLKWCRARWHEYEEATAGRRAIEWTRYLRQLLGLTGGDGEEDDLDLLHEADAEDELRGGVRIRETGWWAVAARALDYEVTAAVEGTDAGTDPAAVAGRVREVVTGVASADAVTELTGAEVTAAYEAMLVGLAARREAAAERRRLEATSPRLIDLRDDSNARRRRDPVLEGSAQRPTS